jgi:hypothetical protein
MTVTRTAPTMNTIETHLRKITLALVLDLTLKLLAGILPEKRRY